MDASIQRTYELYRKRWANEPVSREDLVRYTRTTPDNDVQLLVDREYFDAVMAALKQAKHSVLIDTLSLDASDQIGKPLVDALIACKKRGVEVRVVVEGYNTDAIFPWTEASENLERLRKNGIEVFVGRRFLNHLQHRKAVVIDCSTAFVGGTSFDARYAYSDKLLERARRTSSHGEEAETSPEEGPADIDTPLTERHLKEPQWHDLSVKIQGPAAAGMQACVLGSLMFCGSTLAGQEAPPSDGHEGSPNAADGPLSFDSFVKQYFPDHAKPSDAEVAPGPSKPGDARVKLVHSRPGGGAYGETFINAIRSAHSSMSISIPYLVVPEAVSEIVAAAQRGVRVRLLVPGQNGLGEGETGYDEATFYRAGASFYPKLLDAGVEIYEFRGYNHGKAIVVDDDLVWLSTGNPCVFSWYVAFDTSMLVHSRELADQVKQRVFERDCDVASGRADRITEEALRRGTHKTLPGTRLAGWIARTVLRPLTPAPARPPHRKKA